MSTKKKKPATKKPPKIVASANFDTTNVGDHWSWEKQDTAAVLKPGPAPQVKDITTVTVLSEFEARFCEEYLKDLNGTKSFIRAGGDVKEASAATMAYRLLRKLEIQEKLQALAEARSKRVQVDGDKVLSDLCEISESDIRRMYDDRGALLPPNEWPDDLALAIKEVETFEVEEFDRELKMMVKIGETKKVKFWDKIKTRELLGKHKKLFTEKVEHSGSVTLVDLVMAAKKKEQGE